MSHQSECATAPARWWAVDLHVHTPGSRDVPEGYGSAEDIVAAAIGAGLDAIAVTDHNTADWCDRVRAAASGTALLVLSGVEVSTADGHLLGVWEEGTSSSVIDDVLVLLGIETADRGKLDVAAACGIAEAARKIDAAGGVAIAAHVDKRRGVLETISVAAHQKRTLRERCLSAVEVVDLDVRDKLDGKVGPGRVMAVVQGSDTWDASLSRHSLGGIGARRTWVKASRPDLVGIRHALADPGLRVRVGTAPPDPAHPVIHSVEIVGGFLGGQKIVLCSDLNCLLGGTGTGKSLALEAIRYALDQQVNAKDFPAIHGEVQSRLKAALGLGMVKLELTEGGQRYRVERSFTTSGNTKPTVYQEMSGGPIEINNAPADLVTLAAFSQGEVLEYSRRPVGRMSLIDASVDISDPEMQIDGLGRQAAANASKLIAAKRRVDTLGEKARQETELAEQVRQLAVLFDTHVVRQQESWTKESGKLAKVADAVSALKVPDLKTPSLPSLQDIEDNSDLFAQTSAVLQDLTKRLEAAASDIMTAVSEASQAIEAVRTQWQTRHKDFQAKLDAELEKIDGQSSLTTLRTHLGSLQEQLAAAHSASEELSTEAVPELATLEGQREQLLDSLQNARQRRRELRRHRVSELNDKTAGFVRLDVPDHGDFEDYRKALDVIKVGSRVREDVLDALARHTHPIRLARLLWQGKFTDLADTSKGIDEASVVRLYANIDEKNLWQQLFDLQLIDRPDVLSVKFKKPDDGVYTSIESLAHGQRCTAILIILLADGNTPVLVDQPEDALHAPWIEEYLVDRLRALRGSRQYIFATRSPGIVVSGDAEQIITMKATAGRGELEASGSLERYDLNRLVLYHLEGGPVPFSRRTQKLSVSAESTSPRVPGAPKGASSLGTALTSDFLACRSLRLANCCGTPHQSRQCLAGPLLCPVISTPALFVPDDYFIVTAIGSGSVEFPILPI